MEKVVEVSPVFAPLDAVSKSMEFSDLPYLRIMKWVHRVLDGKAGQQVLDSLSNKGVIGLTYWENDFRHLTNSQIKQFTDCRNNL